MLEIWLPLAGIPAMGQTLTLDDQRLWAEPVQEFGLSMRISTPLRCELFLQSQLNGCLVRGHLTGMVAVPCDRCTEETEIRVDHQFDSFEFLPGTIEVENDEEFVEDVLVDMSVGVGESDVSVMRLSEHGAPEINIAALCWQEFMLCMPVKPLCMPNCKGLCSQCGVNLNEGSCTCTRDEGDPRLAVLRSFTPKTH